MKKLILTILLTSTIWSCGSRKSNIEITDTEKKTEAAVKENSETSTKADLNLSESNTGKVVTNTTVDAETGTEETTTEYTPINPNAPMKTVDSNGKEETLYNGSKKTTTTKGSTKTNIVENKTEDVAAKKTLEITAAATKTHTKDSIGSSKETSATKVKVTDRKESYSWMFGLMGIAVGLFIIFLWRKYNKAIEIV